MKLALATIGLLLGLLLGHMHPHKTCMDPNANIPIDCSLVK